ncbi:MAG: bifunctional adenosylcobinamide kinase/adenosylcobinamide-phosphate guanylyltransferase [Desulfonatronovibrionaceae bacterium]
MITLILGGNKSGKSDIGLDILFRSPGPRIMVVTGKALDADFRDQINRHRLHRPDGLEVEEADLDLLSSVKRCRRSFGSVLIDSLDFWLYQIQAEKREGYMHALLQILEAWTGPRLIFVSCELGLGPIPASRETRRFCRDLGALHLRLAAKSERVCLAVAGCPVHVKGDAPENRPLG